MSLAEFPLFPLNTVLFPGGILPLRIFEPRYVDMVRRCMRDGGEFGVVCIRKGVEAGGDAVPYDVGTLARIVDFDQLPGRLLGITARGTRRFRTLQSRIQEDGLHVADIEPLAAELQIALPQEFERYAELLKQALPEMGAYFAHLEMHPEDSAWVSGRLAEILPIPLSDKQRLLEIDDPIARLHILQPLMQQTAAN